MKAAERETVFEALFTGALLADDLVAMEKAGLSTGFKPGVPKKFKTEMNRALRVIDATKPKLEETKMLEEQIEKLADRVGAVEAGQNKTNDLLGQILAAIKEGGAPTAPAAANEVEAPAEKQATKPKRAKKVEEPTPDEPDEADEPFEDEAKVISLSDVRDALMAHKTACGRAATVALIERHVTKSTAPVLGNIPEDKFATVLAECHDEQAEAA